MSFKKFTYLFIALITLGSAAQADVSNAERTFDPNLLVFAGELRTYIGQAQELATISEDKMEEREIGVQELKATGSRIGKIYFKQSDQAVQDQLNKHLQKALKENAPLKNYFVFLGNAFAEQAMLLLQIYKNKQKQIRTYITFGGAGVGVIVGGGYLFFRLKSTSSGMATGFAAKDFGIAAAAVAGGTAVGFGIGTIYSGKLPMDPAIQNAKDFSVRFPHGEDFINHLDNGSDLKLLMSVLSDE